MKRIRKWWMLAAMVASPTLFGMSCGTNMRDAVWAGALDFLTGSTTDALTTFIGG